MNIEGNIKKEFRLKLEEFYGKQCSKSDFIDTELLRVMLQITSETGYEVAALIDRRGVVQDLFVGTKSAVMLPNDSGSKRRFNGLRVIHTHPGGNGNLSNPDISALLNAMYDCMVAVGVHNGQFTFGAAAFIKDVNERSVIVVKIENPNYINKYGLLEKMYEAEKDFLQKQSKLKENAAGARRAVLVVVEVFKGDRLAEDLAELKGLTKTAGIEIVGTLTQKRDKPDGRYFIGQGKLSELKVVVQNEGANLVIFDNVLSGSKQNNLNKYLGVDVIDRSMLILEIFSMRAKSREGKLQVELARLKYLLPRAAYLGSSASDGSGVAGRGIGESKLELNRRNIEGEIARYEKELAAVKKNRSVSRSSRDKSDMKNIGLVGYTNSGKSTLMNALSGAGVYEEDELFATLDTTTRKVWLKDDTQVLLTDTVGFINKLPHEFIHAFSSTLQETVFSDLLLHVIDCSNPEHEKQREVVEQLLLKIKASAPVIYVYNKIDKCTTAQLDTIKAAAPKNSVFISAKKLINLQELKKLLLD